MFDINDRNFKNRKFSEVILYFMFKQKKKKDPEKFENVTIFLLEKN